MSVLVASLATLWISLQVKTFLHQTHVRPKNNGRGQIFAMLIITGAGVGAGIIRTWLQIKMKEGESGVMCNPILVQKMPNAPILKSRYAHRTRTVQIIADSDDHF